MKIITTILITLFFGSNLLSQSKFFSINKSTQELCLISENGSLQVLSKLSFVDENGMSLEYNPNTNSLLILKGNGELYSFNLNSLESNLLYTLNNSSINLDGNWAGISINSLNQIFVFNERSGSDEGRLYQVLDINSGLVAPFTDNFSGSPSILGIEFDEKNRLWNIEQCCNHRLNVLDGFKGQVKQMFDKPVSINYPQDLAYNPDTEKLLGIDIKNEFTATRTDFFFADRNNGSTEIFLSLEGNYNGIAELTIMSSVNNDVNIEDKFQIYPNPSQQYISIDYNGLVNNIRILDLNGNQVLFNISSLKNIDISKLSSGAYILSFNIENRTFDRKFIKY